MEYRVLDLSEFPRAEQFRLFCSYANPYLGLTAEVDITGFLTAVRNRSLPFFLSFLYCVGRAANRVPQLRQRILNGQPVEFTDCMTSHTVLLEDGSYSYCALDCMQPFADFLPQAEAAHEKAKHTHSLDDGADALGLLFISCLPWIHFTDLSHPTPVPADSNPRITWGRFDTRDGRTTLPVNLLVNHALADGLHIAQFFRALEQEMQDFCREICGNS